MADMTPDEAKALMAKVPEMREWYGAARLVSASKEEKQRDADVISLLSLVEMQAERIRELERLSKMRIRYSHLMGCPLYYDGFLKENRCKCGHSKLVALLGGSS